MIIYNVTTKVHGSIAKEWLQWMKDVHVKEILETGCFTNFKIVKLLEIDEGEGPTYALQLYADSKAIYNQYVEKFAGKMRQQAFDKWGDKFISIRSVMQIVE
ncbi:MAG: DUF4286 family protein [Ferruginibacter sp.]|nr:DUF4286 family protein [Ferruginibacter sp.]